jgi:hypothetical protein
MNDIALVSAHNIINQLSDLWQVTVPVRQDTNDRADQFTSAVIRMAVAAELVRLLDEDLFPCHCARSIEYRIGELKSKGICADCLHPMAWHDSTLGVILTCKYPCNCRIEKSH